MKIVIDIPDNEVPKRREIVEIGLQFMEGEVCECTYPFQVLPKEHGRAFEGIEVTYPPADLCPYPEYKGKPYFSIKFEENGEHFVGFGTYNPEVFSRYLQEYFITPTIIEADKE